MNLEKLLAPRTVCVVGASEKEGFGGDTCRNILSYVEDLSHVYFVNPNRSAVFGRPCYPSVCALPEEIDLIILCTPRGTVEPLLREAAKKGAGGAVVFASGYNETGSAKDNAAAESLRALCAELDIALMGPNCAGFVNYTNNTQAFAFLSEKRERRGSIGVISQSGQLALSLMDMANLRFSCLISVGNGLVLHNEDYLEYLVDDPHTKVIALYLEGVRDHARFAQALKKAALKRKPVVALKAGSSEKGSVLAATHTGSIAGSDKVFDALFAKFGVIRVADLQELAAMAFLLDTLPALPKLPGIASMNLSGGETGICADVGGSFGVDYPDFAPETAAKLREILPYYATPNNPLDMTASLSYDAELYASAVNCVMDDPNVGLVAVGYTLLEEIADPAIVYMAKGLAQVMARPDAKPVVMVPFAENTRNREYAQRLAQIGIPVLPPPQYAFCVIKKLCDYIAYDPHAHCLDIACGEPPKWAVSHSEHESKEFVRQYGIPVTREAVAHCAEEAAAYAAKIGFPVAMKVNSAKILHKSDAGCVRLNVTSAREAREAYAAILTNANAYLPGAARGVLVQEMLPRGTEMIVGVTNTTGFGPCVVCGLGGLFVEVLGDTALALAPLSRREAHAMIGKLKGAPILSGVRGGRPADVEALADVLVAVGKMAAQNAAQLKELDLNPVFVYEKGVCAADALALIQEAGALND